MGHYEDTEESVVQAQLIELYEFKVGVLTYRYTSSDRDQVPSASYGFVWESETISRTKFGQTDELNQENINISLHKDNAIAQLYKGRPPDQTIVLTIFRYHEEYVNEQDVVCAWSGRVLSCSFKGDVAELVCESTATSLKQPGLTRRYQGSCPHAVYSAACGVIKADKEFYTTVSVVTDNIIEATGASAYSNDHFTGGYINWLGDDGNLQSRMIIAHTGEQLTLDWAIDDMAVLDQLWVYPGCKHTMTDCFNKFLNIENYGGFPYIPKKNPYATTVY